ncbi:D-aminoacyl-tRNA deacylase [Oribacterium asaccharolyticum]|uniref:D-aminoacyl-tRNA deacylase n=1 Tax=Oribacterium asaccharolyticum TaxID=1501332 RepID=UPI0028F0795D|nr:D-aminoacyl-tRNA deacylase [Oribacterium asaccharolyticum]
MRCLVQRVLSASVSVSGESLGRIERGYLILLGVNNQDTEAVADKMLKKILDARLFEDENGKTNLSIRDISGSLLIVSQFTLYADTRKGNRPSFIQAGAPAHANALYEYFLQKAEETGIPTAHGQFGADMKVSLVNDGPFTIMYDSDAT